MLRLAFPSNPAGSTLLPSLASPLLPHPRLASAAPPSVPRPSIQSNPANFSFLISPLLSCQNLASPFLASILFYSCLSSADFTLASTLLSQPLLCCARTSHLMSRPHLSSFTPPRAPSSRSSATSPFPVTLPLLLQCCLCLSSAVANVASASHLPHPCLCSDLLPQPSPLLCRLALASPLSFVGSTLLSPPRALSI
jgi:hypothetical protein